LLAKLRTLDRDMAEGESDVALADKSEIDGLARAARIVSFFDKEAAARGEGVVLYDFPRSQQGCGVGL
jgi:hypothetical protein